MALIGFLDQKEHNWVVAGWAYRQILEDVIARFPKDSEMVNTLKHYSDLDGLMFYFLETSLAARITAAIKQVAEGIWADTIQSSIHDKPFGNNHIVAEYRSSLQRLLSVIPLLEIPATNGNPGTYGT